MSTDRIAWRLGTFVWIQQRRVVKAVVFRSSNHKDLRGVPGRQVPFSQALRNDGGSPGRVQEEQEWFPAWLWSQIEKWVQSIEAGACLEDRVFKASPGRGLTTHRMSDRAYARQVQTVAKRIRHGFVTVQFSNLPLHEHFICHHDRNTGPHHLVDFVGSKLIDRVHPIFVRDYSAVRKSHTRTPIGMVNCGDDVPVTREFLKDGRVEESSAVHAMREDENWIAFLCWKEGRTEYCMGLETGHPRPVPVQASLQPIKIGNIRFSRQPGRGVRRIPHLNHQFAAFSRYRTPLFFARDIGPVVKDGTDRIGSSGSRQLGDVPRNTRQIGFGNVLECPGGPCSTNEQSSKYGAQGQSSHSGRSGWHRQPQQGIHLSQFRRTPNVPDGEQPTRGSHRYLRRIGNPAKLKKFSTGCSTWESRSS